MTASAPTLCKCGCGTLVTSPSGYARGHWARSPEGRASASAAGKRGNAALVASRTKHLIVETPGATYTCAYCTGGGDEGSRPEWATRAGFERHMERIHPGLPFEYQPVAHPGKLARPLGKQAIQKEVSEGFSGDDVVTILRVVDVSDAKIERVIELMDFIEKIRRGEA